MDDLFAELIFKIPHYRTVKSKFNNKNDPTYDFSGLFSIDDEDFKA